jgi:hypothetical protein
VQYWRVRADNSAKSRSDCASDEFKPDTDAIADTDASANAGTNAVSNADANAGTDAVSDAGAFAGTDAGTDAGSDAGSDAGTDADTDAASDAASNAGSLTGTDAASNTSALADALTGTDAASDDGDPNNPRPRSLLQSLGQSVLFWLLQRVLRAQCMRTDALAGYCRPRRDGQFRSLRVALLSNLYFCESV